jgi:SAM-dependent methyltransferase
MNDCTTITWTEGEETRSARWQSEAGMPPPKRVVAADDTLTADMAYRNACSGTAMLWRSDFQNARQLLQALARRADGKNDKPKRVRKEDKDKMLSPRDAFNRHRLAQSQRARILGMLLIPFDADYGIPLGRAPDVREACTEAYGPADTKGSPFIATLRELLGLIGAHEWRKKGIEVAALGARIHPHYGIFSPVRGEYIQMVATAPVPAAAVRNSLAFDVGTGTGVLAAMLAKRGIRRVVATDQDPRALACAQDNIERLDFGTQVQIVSADLFPPGRAPLVVCNPPWIPARPSSPIEHAIYDPDSSMLLGFLNGLAAHLEPGGEGWLILSDIAEHLGLRTREELLAAIAAAGLKVVNRIDVRPAHPKAFDATDPLHEARAKEITSLWVLAAQ